MCQEKAFEPAAGMAQGDVCSTQVAGGSPRSPDHGPFAERARWLRHREPSAGARS
jgi:hypothetical protein